MSDNPASDSASVSEFEDRIEKAAAAMKVGVEFVRDQLAEMGIEGDDAIELLEDEATTADLAESTFMNVEDEKSRPKIIPFRRGWRILKGSSGEKSAPAAPESSRDDKLVELLRPVEQWSDVEVVEKYGPDCEARVTEEMERRTKGKRCVVFNADGSVDVEQTVTLIRLFRKEKSKKDRETFKVPGGSVVRLYAVGEFPLVFVEECPLHGTLTLLDGYCEECQDSWKGISDDDRVIVRVAVEVDPDLASGPMAIAKLIKRIRDEESAKFLLDVGQIGLHYQDLKEEGRLPILRRKMSTTKNGDPFYSRHQSF
jgi:hypothetical protein